MKVKNTINQCCLTDLLDTSLAGLNNIRGDTFTLKM